jgi:hypothetical protein
MSELDADKKSGWSKRFRVRIIILEIIKGITIEVIVKITAVILLGKAG